MAARRSRLFGWISTASMFASIPQRAASSTKSSRKKSAPWADQPSLTCPRCENPISQSRGDTRGNASIRRTKNEGKTIHQGHACARNDEPVGPFVACGQVRGKRGGVGWDAVHPRAYLLHTFRRVQIHA